MWAKVVENEIMQVFDGDPTGLWHPDALVYWQEVPDHAFIGWKFKNNQWISGAQWMEEFLEENPPPPPGPPTANISTESTVKTELGIVDVVFNNMSAGIIDSFEWSIDGKTYTDEVVNLTFTQGDTERTVPVSLTVTGPGGTVTNTLEGDQALVISEKFVPLFMKYINP